MRAGIFVCFTHLLQTHETACETLNNHLLNEWIRAPISVCWHWCVLVNVPTRVWAPEGHSLCCSCLGFQSPEQCELCTRPFMTGIKEGISLLEFSFEWNPCSSLLCVFHNAFLRAGSKVCGINKSPVLEIRRTLKLHYIKGGLNIVHPRGCSWPVAEQST